MMLVVIPLALFGIVTPCILIRLDSLDAKKMSEDSGFGVEDDTLKRFEISRRKSSKVEVMLNEKEISKYVN